MNRVCSRCGTTTQEGWSFCATCGSRVTQQPYQQIYEVPNNTLNKSDNRGTIFIVIAVLIILLALIALICFSSKKNKLVCTFSGENLEIIYKKKEIIKIIVNDKEERINKEDKEYIRDSVKEIGMDKFIKEAAEGFIYSTEGKGQCTINGKEVEVPNDVMNVIDEAKKGTEETTANYLIKSYEDYYMLNTLKDLHIVYDFIASGYDNNAIKEEIGITGDISTKEFEIFELDQDGRAYIKYIDDNLSCQNYSLSGVKKVLERKATCTKLKN